MRCFLDASVVLDLLLDGRPAHRVAADFVRMAVEEGHDLVLSTSQVTDVHYIARKLAGGQRARDILRTLFQLCELAPASGTACTTALDSPIDDFEDAVQIETAREARCSLIVTRNLRDFAASPIPAIDPASYMAQHGSEGEGGATARGR